MKDHGSFPFKSDFLDLIPDPQNPPIEHNPCLSIDPRSPEFLEIARQCPFRDSPVLHPPPGTRLNTTAPDLVIAAHQSVATSSTQVVHAITVRNIGDDIADITDPLSDGSAAVQFYVSLHPLLDGELGSGYAAAGGWSLSAQRLEPGQEVNLVFDAGTGVPPAPGLDFLDFNYVIAHLHGNPANDINEGNNLSIVPLLTA